MTCCVVVRSACLHRPAAAAHPHAGNGGQPGAHGAAYEPAGLPVAESTDDAAHDTAVDAVAKAHPEQPAHWPGSHGRRGADRCFFLKDLSVFV